MFLDYFQLREQPFALTCDPPRAFACRSHLQVLDALRNSLLQERGHLALMADSGMGKTTLLHELLARLHECQRPAFLFSCKGTSREILQDVLAQLNIQSSTMETATMLRTLRAVWFAEMLAGKRFVLLFDDAENLHEPELETLRQLSKFETSHSSFLQLVLCGKPALSQKLEEKDCAQLQRRLADAFHLPPFSLEETADYIRHRLCAAGHVGDSLFTPDAVEVIAERSQGNPKNINKICSRALLEAYARGRHSIDGDIVIKAERNLAAAAPSMATNQPDLTSLTVRQTGARTARPRWTYRKPLQFRIPGSGLWVGAVLGVLLSAGLALPHGMLKGVSQMIRGPEASQGRAVPLEQATAIAPATILPVPDAPTRTTNPTPRSSNSNGTQPQFVQPLPKSTSNAAGQLSLTRELGLKINRIVIDPGHGGFDTGAKGPNGLLEKDLCLDVALRLGQMIEENIPGAEVIYTRKGDTYIPLEERTAIANAARADLFISVHANSSDSREVRGVETFYLSLATSKEAKELAIRENALTQSSLHDLPELVRKITQNEKLEESKRLAAQIQDALSERLQNISHREKNRGVKQAPFVVLAGADMPAVLSEISFVSNASDESLLVQGGQRQRIAQGLYRGIADYLEGLRGVPENKQKLVTENRDSADHHAAATDKSLFD